MRRSNFALRVPPTLLAEARKAAEDRKSTRLNSSHGYISYAVFCLKKKKSKHRLNSSPEQRTENHDPAVWHESISSSRTQVCADSGSCYCSLVALVHPIFCLLVACC